MDSVAFSDKKLMRRSATTMPPPPPTTTTTTTPSLMLKDYLLDDMSSCSSNGFRSLPRRQCCSSVRFILEFDLKKTKSNPPTSPFRRASTAVINAVKIFPFSSSKRRSSILSRSLSRKLCKRSFWKKSSDKEISFLKPFKCLNENSLSVSQPSSAAAAAAVIVGARKGKSLSDSSSVFTTDNLLSSSCNSESSCDNNVVLTEISPEKPVSKIVAVAVGKYDSSASSTGTAKEEWGNPLEEKEQFSPISVLDFPFDNQVDVSWPFRRNVPILEEGEKQKLTEKFKIFKSLSKLEPVNLNNEFATIEVNKVSSNDSDNNKDNKVVRADELVEAVKNACRRWSQVGYKVDALLVDFFNERINVNVGDLSKKFERDEAIRVAENWMNGQPEELFLGWEVQENRNVYIKYMENGGKFYEEKEETAKEIEDEILSCLLDELLL